MLYYQRAHDSVKIESGTIIDVFEYQLNRDHIYEIDRIDLKLAKQFVHNAYVPDQYLTDYIRQVIDEFTKPI